MSRITATGIDWATTGPDSWEWRGYRVERKGQEMRITPPDGNSFPLNCTLRAAKELCEMHYNSNQPTE